MTLNHNARKYANNRMNRRDSQHTEEVIVVPNYSDKNFKPFEPFKESPTPDKVNTSSGSNNNFSYGYEDGGEGV